MNVAAHLTAASYAHVLWNLEDLSGGTAIELLYVPIQITELLFQFYLSILPERRPFFRCFDVLLMFIEDGQQLVSFCLHVSQPSIPLL